MGRDSQRGTLKRKAKDAILRYIKEMDITADNRLPSEHQMCDMIGVSRITVRAALDELVAEGLVFRSRGSGTYVNTAFRRITASLIPYNSFENIIKEHGNIPRVKKLGTEAQPADEAVAEALGIPCGSEIVRSRSLIYADNNFCIFNIDYMERKRLSPRAMNLLENESTGIYEVMYESTGLTVAWDSMELLVTDNLRTPELCQHMQAEPGLVKSFLVQQVVSYDAENVPLFYSVIHFDPDYFRFGLIRKVEATFDQYAREDYSS